MVQMLEAHDRDRFEVTLYSAGPDDGSPMRARLRGGDRALRGPARPDARGDGAAHPRPRHRHPGRREGRDPRHADAGDGLRAAPLQVSWLGLPGHHRRELRRLPHRRPGDDADGACRALQREAGADAAAATSRTTRSVRCPHPSTPRRLGRCPRTCRCCAPSTSRTRSPRRVRQLVPHPARRARRRAVADALEHQRAGGAGGGGARARHRPRRGCVSRRCCRWSSTSSRLACADLYLDAWPCNAHTTAGEALWVGVPVVTLIGPTFAQRVAPSLLTRRRAARTGQRSVDAYEHQVVALAGDAPRRAGAARAPARPARQRAVRWPALRARHRVALRAHVGARRRRPAPRAPERRMTALAATRPPAMDARALTQRGVELQGQGRHQEAVNCFMQSLALKIDDAFTHYRLGISFRDCGMKLEAAECIRTAITLGFDDALFARGLLVYLEREGCRWASCRRRMACARGRAACPPRRRCTAGQPLRARGAERRPDEREAGRRALRALHPGASSSRCRHAAPRPTPARCASPTSAPTSSSTPPRS